MRNADMSTPRRVSALDLAFCRITLAAAPLVEQFPNARLQPDVLDSVQPTRIHPRHARTSYLAALT